MMRVFRHHAAEEVARSAASALDALCMAYHTTPLLLLFSGGSTFSLLKTLRCKGEGGLLTVSVLDERYSHDPAVNPVTSLFTKRSREQRAMEFEEAGCNGVNNFSQLAATLWYERAVANGCRVIDTRVRDGETRVALAGRMQSGLRSWKDSYPSGKVIITQGMGADGHTAGMMPFPEDAPQFEKLFCGEDWVVEYDAGEKNPYPLRATTTMTFLRDVVDHSIVSIVGEEKEAAWKHTFTHNGALAETPMRVIHEMNDVKIFTTLQ